MKNLPLVLLVLFMSELSFGQNEGKPETWSKIDSAIQGKKNLQDVYVTLSEIKEQALRANNMAVAGRCFYYLLQVADLRTEDSLYFRNSRFIDSIINARQSPLLLKAIMHVLQAKRLTTYLSRFFYRNNKNGISSYNRYDYSKMSRLQLDTLIDEQYEAALQISFQVKGKIEDLLWLSDDPLTFLFKPDFSDLIYAGRIHAFQSGVQKEYAQKNPGWLSLSPDQFIRLSDTAQTFTKGEQMIFRLYKQWMQYHQPVEPQAYYFIETLARKFFYENINPDSFAKNIYEQYLQQNILSPYATVKAHAVYQLCLLWNSYAASFNSSATDYNTFYRNSPLVKFDSAYRLYYVRALDLYTRHDQLLDSFYFMKKILLAMQAKMLSPSFSIRTNSTWLPDEPILGFVQYRNVNRMYMRIIKIHAFDTLYSNRDRNISRLLQLPYTTQDDRSMQLPADYQWHNTFVKLDPLPTGRYILLYSDTVITSQPGRVNYIALNVTNIAVINNDQRVYVLNRKTGFPLENAGVSITVKREQKVQGKTSFVWKNVGVKKVNSEGYVTVNEKDVTGIKVMVPNDSMETDLNKPKANLSGDIFDKDVDGDLMEYYADNIKLQLFTDRAIYRPGQTVYYKGIFTVPHPKTGQLLVLNWHSLQFPFYKKLLYKLQVLLSKRKIEFYVKDPFNRSVDTIHVRPNKYGSFTGSFALSKEAATGDWNFDMENFELAAENTGDFKVEEYQRPTYEISLEKPKTELYLGDSFHIKVKAMSFAAAQLSNTKIHYSVSRSGDLPDGDGSVQHYSTAELSAGQAYTNEKGELLITVQDSALNKYHFSDKQNWTMNYTIEAEATDATGESHEADVDLSLSTRPVIINIPVPAMIDRSELLPVYISARSDLAGQLKKQVEVKIYKVISHSSNVQSNPWPNVDIWLYSRQELMTWFPGMNFNSNNEPDDEKQQIYTTTLLADDEKLVLPKELLQSGCYSIEAVCKKDGKIIGEASRSFSVFDTKTRSLPSQTSSLHYLPFNAVENGKLLTWITGNTEQDIYSIYHVAYYVKSKKGMVVQYDYDNKPEKKGLNEWRYVIPRLAVNEVVLTHLYIVNNQLYRQEQTVRIPDNYTINPEIVVEQYRKQLVPGGMETFVVSVKTKNEHAAAELMTTMYDASLDKLEKHVWSLPRYDQRFSIDNAWNHNIGVNTESSLNIKNSYASSGTYSGSPLWWINADAYSSGGYNVISATNDNYSDGYKMNSLNGRAAGLSILNSSGLNDVVVVGYGTSVKRNLTGSLITIRGAASLSNYPKALVVIDGVPYEGGLSKIDLSSMQGIVLKGADATAIYGSRAANGVLILSTKGLVQIPELVKEPPPPVLRKNFAETAFFFPQIHAGRNGYYTFSFTLPESVTKWNWKMLAHTKKAAFAYAEKTLYSQLPLMVQPAVPRFLYQGDRIVLKSRITNMDTVNASGVLTCSIEDMVTGDDISSQLLSVQQQNFTVRSMSNSSGMFTITIPENLLHPVRIKISGATKNYGDGEEHIIPILSKKILATYAVPLILDKEKKITVTLPAFPGDAAPYGMGLYIIPKPQAAILYALPYLAFYPYGCAEQTLNKLLAHAVAIKIVRTDTALQRSLRTKNFSVKGTTAGELIPEQSDEQSMPWLQLSHFTAIRQQQLTGLLDTLEAHRQIEKYFMQISDMQNNDGGVSWFKGGKSSDYMSSYLLAGLGKLQYDQLLYISKNTADTRLPDLLSGLIRYCDTGFTQSPSVSGQIGYGYARTFWLKQYPLSPAIKIKLDSLLKAYWARPDVYSLGRQAEMITITLRFAEKTDHLYHAALQQLESIRQLAITDEVTGVRWKDISDKDDLTTQTEEWIVKIAEAFETGGQSKETITGIINWLLHTKQEHNWSTTKSTAEVISLLSRHQTGLPATPLQLEAGFEGSSVKVTNDIISGNPYVFIDRAAKNFPVSTTIQSANSLPVTGALTYYYFTSKPLADSGSRSITISKALFRYNGIAKKWDTVHDGSILGIGDKIKTVLTITTPRLLQYVFIDDKRAAALEPADGNSAYRNENGLSFYESVKDAAMLFFAEKIPAGIYNITYETVATKEGLFTNGPASLQCMYQPAVKAYSTAIKLEISMK